MNAGLIIGNVWDKSRNKVSEAKVTMFNLRGKAGGVIPVTGDNNNSTGSAYTTTNSNGYFELAFAWSGGDIAWSIGAEKRASMTIYASIDVWQSDKVNTEYTSPFTYATGFMVRDVFGLAGLTPPDLRTFPGMLEFSKDFLESLSKLKFHSVFKQNRLSTESWLILSAANLFINKY